MTYFEMAKTAIRTVLSRPVTILYPVQAAKKTGLSRGHVTIDPARCISCGTCQRKCPAQAILVSREAKTWQIDRFRCVVCNSCVETCPVKCLFMDTQYSSPATSKGVEVVAITYVKPEKPPAGKAESTG